MARSRLLDFLQSFRFHLFDVPKLSGGAGATGFSLADSVFTAVAGFTNISHPELTLETETIKEGTFMFDRHFSKRASVGPMVLARGARYNDSEFWAWASGMVLGVMPRRDLVLVQFTAARTGTTRSSAGRAANATSDATAEQVRTDFLLRVPGKVWYLFNCLPTRYKAGGDLDSRSSDISIAELEIQPEVVSEISPSTLFPRIPF